MQEEMRTNRLVGWAGKYRPLLPGVAIAVGLALTAWGLQWLEEIATGRLLIEGLVIAILLGMLWRTFVGLRANQTAGVKFTAKQVLEFAIVLLGAGVDLPALLKAGPGLLLAIVLLVLIGITASLMIGRLIGLNPKLATLVAVGNSICGNSAIAAVAPVIGASAADVASAIALTAVLGVVVVITLPLLIGLFSLSLYQYGVLAGMSVYAVPQVVAASFAVSPLSGQIGTLVKLVRVLMLGPVVLFFSLRNGEREAGSRIAITRYVPWFIIGFVLMAALRSFGLLPVPLADALRTASTWLTVAAMAALGLEVDIRTVGKVGLSVAGAVVGSLIVMISVALLLIFGFGING